MKSTKRLPFQVSRVFSVPRDVILHRSSHPSARLWSLREVTHVLVAKVDVTMPAGSSATYCACVVHNDRSCVLARSECLTLSSEFQSSITDLEISLTGVIDG
jgi:hypothetical protein